MSKEAIPGLPDFIAVSALAILSDWKVSTIWSPARIATYCYDIADAMLAERDKRNNKEENNA
jgi:hypothetical protein